MTSPGINRKLQGKELADLGLKKNTYRRKSESRPPKCKMKNKRSMARKQAKPLHQSASPRREAMWKVHRPRTISHLTGQPTR